MESIVDLEKFFHYLTLPYLYEGMVFTLQLTVFGFAGGLLLGLILAALQMTRFPVLTALSRGYCTLYRGTPLILQLVFVFTVLPHVGLVLAPVVAGSVALAMNEAVFFAEIFRSGIRGVDAGQTSAGRALGLPPQTLMQRVIAPQAIRQMIPALGNEAVSTMKNSALASIIAVTELTLRTQQLASATFDYFEIYFATAVMYLFLTGVLTVVQLLVEDALDLDRSEKRRLFPRLVGKRKTAATPVTVDNPAAEIADIHLDGGIVPPTRADLGETMIDIADVHKSYGPNEVLKGISMTVKQGEVVALLGPSGSGKSTLLRTINNLERIDSGTILVGGELIGFDSSGRPLSEKAAATQRVSLGVGMVFQQFNLFHHLTVMENIAAPLRWVNGTAAESANKRAESLLKQVGLTHRAQAMPRQLSGGQQQRVGIARAIASSPRVLLLDEPTSALDPELVAEVLTVIKELAHTHRLTMIIATHQLRFALDVADRVVFMAGGVVVEEGAAEQVIRRPSNEITARFMGAMSAAEV
jgi:polar amino acid transport system permease protein